MIKTTMDYQRISPNTCSFCEYSRGTPESDPHHSDPFVCTYNRSFNFSIDEDSICKEFNKVNGI